jgi:hypothetical protein
LRWTEKNKPYFFKAALFLVCFLSTQFLEFCVGVFFKIIILNKLSL